MSIKAVLFDLDGTLLPMDQDVFINKYFTLLSDKLVKHGYDRKLLVDAIWTGTGAMVRNDGAKKNEDVFWDKFAEVLGDGVRADEPYFEEFYSKDFDKVREVCGYSPDAALAVAEIKKMGYRTALATNPVFPAIATEKRMAWAGLSPEDFELYTTYENSRYCKPNPAYYMDIVNALGVKPEECLMVGNDVSEDMIAETLGMKVFLLPACLINKEGKDISTYPNGGFFELIRFLETLR